MNRRRLATAVLGILFLIGLAAGGGMPASGNEPEGGDGITLDVDPSDDLPVSSLVTVTGAGFFSETSIPPDVTIRQCYVALEACGPATVLKENPDGTFTGSVPAVRFLSLSDTTVDCAQVVCEMWAEGSRFATHHLTFSRLLPTTTSTTTQGAGADHDPPPGGRRHDRARAHDHPGHPPPARRDHPADDPGHGEANDDHRRRPPRPPPSRPRPPPRPPRRRPATARRSSPSRPRTSPQALRVAGCGSRAAATPARPSTSSSTGPGSGRGRPTPPAGCSRAGCPSPATPAGAPTRSPPPAMPPVTTIETASLFEVLPVSVHRPAFVTSLPLPGQISLDPGALLASGAIALGAIILIAFPFELFNSAMEENYDEIRGWFGMGPRGVPEVKTRSHTLGFFGLIAVTARGDRVPQSRLRLQPDERGPVHRDLRGPAGHGRPVQPPGRHRHPPPVRRVGQAQLPARQPDRHHRHGGRLPHLRVPARVLLRRPRRPGLPQRPFPAGCRGR